LSVQLIPIRRKCVIRPSHVCWCHVASGTRQGSKDCKKLCMSRSSRIAPECAVHGATLTFQRDPSKANCAAALVSHFIWYQACLFVCAAQHVACSCAQKCVSSTVMMMASGHEQQHPGLRYRFLICLPTESQKDALKNAC